MDHLTRRLNRNEQARAASYGAEKCIVARTAVDETSRVEVTLPNSEDPLLRIPVQWRVAAEVVGGNLVPRYPIRGDEGIVIYDDEGEAWLIW